MQHWTLQWKVIALICAICIVGSFGIILSMYKDIREVLILLRNQQQQQASQQLPEYDGK